MRVQYQDEKLTEISSYLAEIISLKIIEFKLNYLFINQTQPNNN